MLKKEKFAERLINLRKNKGVSIRKLAQALGLKSHGAITQFEKGTALPAIDTLVALAEYFQVSLDYLLGCSDYIFPISEHLERIIDQSPDPTELLTTINLIIQNDFNSIPEEGMLIELIKGLDEESLIELHKFLRYLYIRQTFKKNSEVILPK